MPDNIADDLSWATSPVAPRVVAVEIAYGEALVAVTFRRLVELVIFGVKDSCFQNLRWVLSWVVQSTFQVNSIIKLLACIVGQMQIWEHTLNLRSEFFFPS